MEQEPAVRIARPTGQVANAAADTNRGRSALRRAVLGVPSQRPAADPVLSSLLGREVAVLAAPVVRRSSHDTRKCYRVQVAPAVGLEPTTKRLTAARSTT